MENAPRTSDAAYESPQQAWDKPYPSDEEIARQVALDPDSAPILTPEERAAKSFVRLPKK